MIIFYRLEEQIKYFAQKATNNLVDSMNIQSLSISSSKKRDSLVDGSIPITTPSTQISQNDLSLNGISNADELLWTTRINSLNNELHSLNAEKTQLEYTNKKLQNEVILIIFLIFILQYFFSYYIEFCNKEKCFITSKWN